MVGGSLRCVYEVASRTSQIVPWIYSDRPSQTKLCPMRKAVLLLVLFALCGCGFKGPLELPPPNPEDQAPQDESASN